MTTTNYFQMILIKEEAYIANQVKLYLASKGYNIESFNIPVPKAKYLYEEDTRPSSKNRHISLYSDGNYQNISTQDILYIRVDHVYVEIYTSQGEKIVERSSLKELLKRLPSDMFIQTHRSFAVNIQQARDWNSKYLFLADQKIPISRGRREKVIGMLKA